MKTTDTNPGGPHMATTEDNYLERLMAQYRQQELARLDTAKARLKTEISPRLTQWGVSKVKAEYSGYGDSGCIDGITYLDAHDQPVNLDLVRAASDPDIENVLYEFLPAGFEINDGGQGTVTIDVQTAKVTLAHQENYTDTRDSTQEFTL
jgi:hypothetical protein